MGDVFQKLVGGVFVFLCCMLALLAVATGITAFNVLLKCWTLDLWIVRCLTSSLVAYYTMNIAIELFKPVHEPLSEPGIVKSNLSEKLNWLRLHLWQMGLCLAFVLFLTGLMWR